MAWLFYIYEILFIYLFGCAGSSLLQGFPLVAVSRAAHRGGFSCRGALAQQLWCTGLAAPWHVPRWWLNQFNPQVGKIPGEGNNPLRDSCLGNPMDRGNNPLQDSCLGNPMDRGAWQMAVQGAVKGSDTT